MLNSQPWHEHFKQKWNLFGRPPYRGSRRGGIQILFSQCCLLRNPIPIDKISWNPTRNVAVAFKTIPFPVIKDMKSQFPALKMSKSRFYHFRTLFKPFTISGPSGSISIYIIYKILANCPPCCIDFTSQLDLHELRTFDSRCPILACARGIIYSSNYTGVIYSSLCLFCF